MAPQINAARLLADLRRLREFGAAEARGFAHPLGVVRPTFTEADMAARRWLAARFEDAGLAATIDGVGNVFGRSRKRGPALLAGSLLGAVEQLSLREGDATTHDALERLRALLESVVAASGRARDGELAELQLARGGEGRL